MRSKRIKKSCFRKTWWIYDVFIFPEKRGTGKSKVMLNLLLEKLPQKTVRLTVDIDNTIAIKAYKSVGFEIESSNGQMFTMKHNSENGKNSTITVTSTLLPDIKEDEEGKICNIIMNK